LIAVPQAATITTHTYTSGSSREHVQGIHSWLEHLAGFLEDVDARFHASTLPTHRFAHSWTPTCLLEALSFDIPVYRLPAPRETARTIEERLTTLGLRLVFLRVPDHRIRAQCVESTRAHRGPRWNNYVSQFGRNDEARAEYIWHAQERLEQWIRTSPMQFEIIDTSRQDWDRYARQIAGLVMSSGQPVSAPVDSTHLTSRRR
jgi:hypothetical protein